MWPRSFTDSQNVTDQCWETSDHYLTICRRNNEYPTTRKTPDVYPTERPGYTATRRTPGVYPTTSRTPDAYTVTRRTPYVYQTTSRTPDVYPTTNRTPDVYQTACCRVPSAYPTTRKTTVAPTTTSRTPDVYPTTSRTPDVYPTTSRTPDVYPTTRKTPDVYSGLDLCLLSVFWCYCRVISCPFFVLLLVRDFQCRCGVFFFQFCTLLYFFVFL